MREEQEGKERGEREEEEGRCVLKNQSLALMTAQERSSKEQTKVSKTSKEAFL